MSRGKPRHAAPQTEREAAEHIRLVQLTRELHEAAQDAREAARELRGARAETAGMVGELITERVRIWDKNTAETISKIAEKFTAKADQVMDREAELLGLGDQVEMLDYIVSQLHESLEPVLTGILARNVEESLDGYIQAALKKLGHDPGKESIIVTTKDMLPAVRDPGLIIDMT